RNRIVCFIGGLCAGSAGYEVGVGWLSSLRLSWVQPRRSYGRRPVQESDGACGVASPQVPYLERSSAPDRGPHRRGGRRSKNRKRAGGLRASNDRTASVMSDVVRRRSSQRCLTLVHLIANFYRFHVVLHTNVSPLAGPLSHVDGCKTLQL